jgi:hypothetical protein
MANETTSEYVAKQIHDFAGGDNLGRGYGFAHIVLGDWNLQHGYIKYCLEPHGIHDWTLQKIEDTFGSVVARDDLDEWQIEDYDEIINERDTVIGFLRWLLSIDEYILEDASQLR